MKPRAWNSTLPQRSAGLNPGKGFTSRGTGLSRNPAKKLPSRRLAAAQAPARARSSGEFTPAVRLLIRTRAGNGDPSQARCEACGMFLGERGGQFQHIYARGAGGCALWLFRSAANGTLLHGTSYTGCHGLCEDRDPRMEAMGFWRRRNGLEKPGDYPITLHGLTGGTARFLLAVDGGYSDALSKEWQEAA